MKSHLDDESPYNVLVLTFPAIVMDVVTTSAPGRGVSLTAASAQVLCCPVIFLPNSKLYRPSLCSQAKAHIAVMRLRKIRI